MSLKLTKRGYQVRLLHRNAMLHAYMKPCAMWSLTQCCTRNHTIPSNVARATTPSMVCPYTKGFALTVILAPKILKSERSIS